MWRVCQHLWAAGMVVEVILLLRARRRWQALREPPPAPLEAAPRRGEELLAAALPFVLLFIVLVLAGAARGHTFASHDILDNPARARATSDALSAQVEILTWGTQLLLPAVLVAAGTLAICAATRARAAGRGPDLRRSLKIAVFVAGGAIVPTGYALAHYTGLLSSSASHVSGLDPEMKTHMLEFGFEEAGEFLRHTMIAAAVLGAVVTLWLARALRRAAFVPWLDAAPRWLAPSAVAAAALLAAAALYMRVETTTPWPEPSRNTAFNVALFEEATSAGPDDAPFGPVLEVKAVGVDVDGASPPEGATDRAGLESLAVLRDNYTLMNPGATFPGKLGVVCRRDVPARRLDDLLQRAAVLGYDHPYLLLPHATTIERPVLGRLERSKPTAVELHVPPEDHKGWLPVAPAGTCGAFTAKALESRRASNYVQLALDWTPEAHQFAPPPRHLGFDEVIDMAKAHIGD
jgi:hypothetical protein